MSWEGGERPRRRWTTPAVVAGCLVAVLVAGTLVRQEGPGPALTVETAPPEPEPAPTPSPENPPTVRAQPLDPGEVEFRQLTPVPDAQGALWVATHAGVLARVDLATGQLVEARTVGQGSEQWGLVPVAGVGVVHVQGPRARLYTAPDAPPVELGEAEQAVASATPGRVWLIGRQPSVPAELVPIREVTADGTVTIEAALPRNVWVQQGVEGGLLVHAAGTMIVYDPVAGEGSRVGDGELLAASARHVARRACDEALRCWIGVGPFDDPDAVRLLASPELLGYGGTLAPDGSRLAVMGQEAGTTDYRPVIVVLDVPSGRLVRLPPPDEIGGEQATPAWDASGRWLFVPGNGTVTAWDPATGATVPLELGLGGIAAIAVQ